MARSVHGPAGLTLQWHLLVSATPSMRRWVMELDINSSMVGDARVIRVGGEVDVYTSPTLKAALLEATGAAAGGQVVVDLDQVGFIDSSGLGVLVGALRRTREAGGDLRIVSARPSVEKIFHITGLDRVFSLYGTVDEALGE